MAFPQTRYESARLEGFRFAAIAHYDAYLNNTGAFAHAIRKAGGDLDIFTLNSRGMTVSEAQLTGARRLWPALGERIPTSIDLDTLAQEAFTGSYDGIFLGAGGQELLTGFQKLADAFATLGSKRPVIITGFPGIIDVGRIGGMLFRCPSDLVLLPAPAQLKIYKRNLSLLGKTTSNAVLYGMPSLPHESRPPSTKASIRRILFIDQSAIPYSMEERRALINDLLLLLEATPNSEIWIRERVKEGETSIHEERAGPKLSALVDQMRSKFPTLSRITIKGEPLHTLFQEVDAVLGISSTGLVEALSAGLTTASLGRFSRVPKYGNGFFKGSGIQVDIQDLIRGNWPVADEEWLKRNVLSPLDVSGADHSTGQERLSQRLQSLLLSPRIAPPNPLDHGAIARSIAWLKPHMLLQMVLKPFG